ncbi:MAG: PAS domain-containing protein [Sphingobacteriales bacterium]|nr:PAS domain-containing protein [Sphingobacteriales bacterium]
MHSIITLVATLHDGDTLAAFLNAAPTHLPDAAFIVFNPSAESSDEEMISFLQANTSFPVLLAQMEDATQANNIYVLSHQNNLLLGNGFFVGNNAIAQRAQSFADAFWQSLAKHQAHRAIAIVFSPLLEEYQSLSAIKSNGGFLARCLPSNTPYLANSKPNGLSALYDVCLSAEDLPAAIAKHLSTAALQHSNAQISSSWSDRAVSVAYNLAQYQDNIRQSDFDDLLQHLRTAVLYLLPDLSIRQFSNFIQHYLSIDDSAVGKSIEAINTRDLSPYFVQWIHAVIEKKTPLQRDLQLPNSEWCDLKIVPIYYSDNEFKGIMISITDTTAIMRVQHILDNLSQEIHSQGKAFWGEHEKARQAAYKKQEALEALGRQGELLNNISQTMREGIISLQTNQQITFINNAAQGMTGLQIGQNILDWLDSHRFFLPDEDPIAIDNAENPIQRALTYKGLEQEDIDLYVVPKNNPQIGWFINIHIQHLQPKSGTQQGDWLVVLRDMTRQKRAELAFHKTERRQKALLLAIPDSMLHINRAGEYINYIPAKSTNPQDQIFEQYERAFFIGNRVQETLGEMGATIMEIFEIALENGDIQTEEFLSFEADRIRHYDIRLSLVNQTEALVLIRDITDVISGRHIADKYSEYYRWLLESISHPIVWLDQTGKVIHATSKIEKVGLSAEYVLGKNFYDFILPADINRARTALSDAFKSNASEIGKYKVLLPDSTSIPVKAKASIIEYGRQRLLQVIIGFVKRRK